MANFNSYNDPYIQEWQSMRNRIDGQIRQLQQQQQMQQMQQPMQPQIHQNFQLAPNPINGELEAKFASNIEEVKNTFVLKTGIFVNKDFSTAWIKDVSGNIKTYSMTEVIEIDPKDEEINTLKKQVEELKGMIANATEHIDKHVDEPITEQKSTRVQSSKRTNEK